MENEVISTTTVKGLYRQKIKAFLESPWAVAVMCALCFLTWIFRLEWLAFFILIAVCFVTFIFCDSLNLVFCAIFALPFFSRFNPIIILFANLLAIIYYFWKHRGKVILSKKANSSNQTDVKIYRLGNLFFPLIIADVAFILAGCFGYFDVNRLFKIILTCVATHFLYFIAINCSKNLADYLLKSIIILAFSAISQFVFLCLCTKSPISAILSREVQWISSMSINHCALLAGLGIFACFYIFENTHKQWQIAIYILVVIYLFVGMLLTNCRAVFLSVIPILLFIVYKLFAKYGKRKYFWWGVGCLALIALLLILISETIRNFVYNILLRGFSGSGREELWPWCWDKFISSPIFGIGFMTDVIPPSTVGYIVACHNTILQWLTSTGVVGTILVIPFYIQKYWTFFCGNRNANFFAYLKGKLNDKKNKTNMQKELANFTGEINDRSLENMQQVENINNKKSSTKFFIFCMIMAIAIQGMLSCVATILFGFFVLQIILVSSVEKENLGID